MINTITTKRSIINLDTKKQYYFMSGKPVKYLGKVRQRYIFDIDGEKNYWTENTVVNTPLFDKNKMSYKSCIIN